MESEKKPVIKTIPNGPYSFKNIPFLTMEKDNSRIELPKQKAKICRCGASGNVPFCDGTHLKIGFSSESVDPPQSREKAYLGKGITVHFDLSVCAHVGICVRGLPEVFNVKKRPWIEPERADVDSLIELIRRCPSGALSYTVDGVRVDSFECTMGMEVVRNGPINVYGGVELQDDRSPKTADHYSLCRCGKSGNKPFCDGAHLGARFEDVCGLKKDEEDPCSP
jgi:CDGSH-type Zn-finger protein